MPRKILFTPSVPYNWMCQRPNHFCYQFALKGWDVIYMQDKNQGNPKGSLPVLPNMKIVTGAKYEDFIGTKIDVVYSISPLNYPRKGMLGEKLFVYDCPDDFSFHWRERETEMTRICDILFTTSDLLMAKKVKERNGNACYLVKNGIDLQYFTPGRHIGCPGDMEGVRRPIIGYAGAMAYWLDYDMIRYASEMLPEFNFVFVGPPFGIRSETEMRTEHNKLFLGIKPMQDIPKYIQHFDVCIIPFLRNDITKHANPIKLYEYLAMGKNVVSSSCMPEVEKYSDVVCIAKDKEEFVELIKQCVWELNSKSPVFLKEKEDKRMNAVKDQTWSNRVDNIISILEKYL